ncbi:uncharacterized protein EV154DRAFT_541518 [Mucor mucedo]|uniref:uncharacterized protein n=1 Tax=Mucor mucedo TaxID=29922 RepID=UPI00221F3E17|nr:uncharacterized protein EV154DRAFT_541518 [Mucor mucedo]KAI7896693.1 hypothetical protein EV154DRAFT_541518 [Mucor mucedo]
MDQHNRALNLTGTEQDLLSSTTCKHGNESQNSLMQRNSSRTVGGKYQEERKTVDLCLYCCGSTKPACLEIGPADGGPRNQGIKSPIIMKNFAIQILQQYGIKMNEIIRIVGFVISGFDLTALLMTFKGFTSLITRSKKKIAASASVILDENDDLPCHTNTSKRKNPEEEH